MKIRGKRRRKKASKHDRAVEERVVGLNHLLDGNAKERYRRADKEESASVFPTKTIHRRTPVSVYRLRSWNMNWRTRVCTRVEVSGTLPSLILCIRFGRMQGGHRLKGSI